MDEKEFEAKQKELEAEKQALEAKLKEVQETNSSAIESIAQKIGWNPDYQGDDAITAEEYILKSKEIDRTQGKTIRHLKGEVAALRQAVDTFVETNRTATENDVKKIENTIKSLKADRQKAVEDSNLEEFNKITAQIEQLEGEVATKKQAPKQSGPSPEYLVWREDNMWYETDPDMKKWAHKYYESAPAEIKALTTEHFLNHVGQKARELFPDKFKHEKKQTQPNPETKREPKTLPQTPVAPGSKKTTKKKQKYSFNDLEYEQKRIATEMVNKFKGTKNEMTLDEYANKVLGGEE